MRLPGLDRYHDAGGHVQVEMFEGSGHGPLFDAAERWSKVFFGFLASIDQGARLGATTHTN